MFVCSQTDIITNFAFYSQIQKVKDSMKGWPVLGQLRWEVGTGWQSKIVHGKTICSICPAYLSVACIEQLCRQAVELHIDYVSRLDIWITIYQSKLDEAGQEKEKVLISSPQQEWTIGCSKRAPQTLKQCDFWIVELEYSCSLHSTSYLIPPLLDNCDSIQSTRAVHYPVNYIAASAVMTENDNLNVTGTTLFGSKPALPMPQIDIKSTTMESVATSHTELTVAFNKIMKRITKNENIYLTKADRMASMKNSVQKSIEIDYSESTSGILVVYMAVTAVAVTYSYYRLCMLIIMLAMLKLPVTDAINSATDDGSQTASK